MRLRATRLSAISNAMRSVFKIASVSPVLWWDAESHRKALTSGGAATLFQDAAGTSVVTAVEQPVGRAVDQSGNARHALQATSTARPLLTARSNVVDISENFAGWGTPGNLTLTADGTNPYGRTAYRLTVNATGSAIISRFVGATGGTVMEVSWWVRKGSFAFATPNEWGIYDNTAALDKAFIRINYDTLVTTVARGSALSHGVMAQAPGGWIRIFVRFAHTPGNSLSVYLGAIGGGTYTAGDYWSCGGVSVTTLASATAASPGYQWSSSATVYDIAPAPLLMRFDGLDDGLASATFAAGTLPANADVWLVLWPDADEQETVLVEDPSASGSRYFATRHPSQSITQQQDGPTTASAQYTVNGVAVAGTTNPTRAQLFTATQTGVPVLLQVAGLNLSSWTQVGLGRYVNNASDFGYKGRYGCLLITPAKPDATRAKIRKALAKAYQITGVV